MWEKQSHGVTSKKKHTRHKPAKRRAAKVAMLAAKASKGKKKRA